MHDIAAQLRQWSHSLAQSVEPVAIERVKAPLVQPNGALGTRRWLVVAASIATLAAGIAAIAALNLEGRERVSPATGPERTDATAVTDPTTTPAPTSPGVGGDRLAGWPLPPSELIPVDDIPLLLPTDDVAMAGVPVRGQAGGGSAAPATFTQVFADADRGILLTLQTRPDAIDSTPSEMRQATAVDGWDEAYLIQGRLPLVVSDPSGFVRLSGTGIDIDQATELLSALHRRPVGTPGWDVSDGHLVEINGSWNDSAGQRSVTWFDGNRVVAQMLASPAYTDLIVQALGSTFEQVDVNGTTGWLNNADARRTIVWSPDGITIVVLGVADDRIDPLAVARAVMTSSVQDYESRTTTDVPPGVGDGCDGSLFC